MSNDDNLSFFEILTKQNYEKVYKTVFSYTGYNWICFSCGSEGESLDYCETCGTPYFADEDDIGMCHSCIDHRMGD